MTQALCRQALEVKLAAWATAQGLTVAYENRPFTAPVGAYARAFLLPVNTVSLTLDRTHRRYRGLFQVSLCMPISAAIVGANPAEQLVASLDAAFQMTPRIGVPALAPTFYVYITEPMSAAPAITEPDRYVVPVTCAYEAHYI